MSNFFIEREDVFETRLSVEEWTQFFSGKGWGEILRMLESWKQGVDVELRILGDAPLYRAQGAARVIDAMRELREQILPKPEEELPNGN